MKLVRFLMQKKVYLLLNIIILLIGYLFIHEGISLGESQQIRSAIYIAIGTSLIAAGIVTFLDLIKHLSIAAVLERHNNIITEAGVQWLYRKRDIDKYDDLMNDLSSELDITGYSLGAFFDSYSHLLKEKVSSKNITVRILLVKPGSVHSAKRAEIEGRNPSQFNDKIETLVSYFKEVKGIEIRYLDAPLSSMIFRIDKVMFVGPHFYRVQSKATYTQELKNDHWLFEEYKKEFIRMWNESVQIS